MAKYSIEEQTLDNIANAILAKTGSSTALTPEQMPTAIAGIQTGENIDGPYIEYGLNEDGNIASAKMNGLSEVRSYQFYNISELETVDFSQSNIISIGSYAFSLCKKLNFTSLPDSITNIKMRAFEYCEELALTLLPNNITDLPYGAFSCCYKLSLTSLPNSITSIGNQAFFECKRINISSLPGSITSLGTRAFYHCTGITRIEIGAKAIGAQAFEECTGLQEVWIRNTCETITATSITTSPFYGCSRTLKIYAEASEKQSGFGSYFNCVDSGVFVEVVYNQTTCPW